MSQQQNPEWASVLAQLQQVVRLCGREPASLLPLGWLALQAALVTVATRSFQALSAPT